MEWPSGHLAGTSLRHLLRKNLAERTRYTPSDPDPIEWLRHCAKMNEISECLQALLDKEATVYQTNDYLGLNSAVPRLHSSHRKSVSCVSTGTDTASRTGSDSFVSPPRRVRKRKLCDPIHTTMGDVVEMELCACCDSRRSTTRGVWKCAAADGAQCENKRRQLWREKLCEWAFQVVVHFQLNREAVTVAMNYFDRLLARRALQAENEDSTPPTREQDEFLGLVMMTALVVAIKLYDYRNLLVPGCKSTTETIVKLGRNAYCLSQVCEQECKILAHLSWCLHPPTPQLFIHRFVFHEFDVLRALPCKMAVYDFATYLVEVSALDYFFVSYKPSEVAISALVYALSHEHPDFVSQNKASLVIGLEDFMESLRTPRIQSCEFRLGRLLAKLEDEESADQDTADSKTKPDERIHSPVSVATLRNDVFYEPSGSSQE